jgi:hypothetical protein
MSDNINRALISSWYWQNKREEGGREEGEVREVRGER